MFRVKFFTPIYRNAVYLLNIHGLRHTHTRQIKCLKQQIHKTNYLHVSLLTNSVWPVPLHDTCMVKKIAYQKTL